MCIQKTPRWLLSKLALAAAFTTSSAVAGEPTAVTESDSVLSRVTIEIPILTRHFPRDNTFNDHNWGAIVDIAVADQWSVVGGYFRNSYYRGTLLVGIGWYPVNFELSRIRFDLGGIAAVDLSGGYKPYNRADPLLGALSIKIGNTSAHDNRGGGLSRLGLAFTIIPAASARGSTGVNLALTYRL